MIHVSIYYKDNIEEMTIMNGNELKKRIGYIIRKIISKFYYYIFAKCLPNKYYPYQFSGGMIYLNIRESPMMLARVIGLYERDKIKLIRSVLKPGMTFIDIGANKGDFSLIAARTMHCEGKVIAFEPEPSNCIWIKKSIDLNKYSNISLFELALGETDECAKLYLSEKSGWHSLVPALPARNIGVIEVEKRTLDSVVEENNYQNINMIKIDVEGFELMVLRGAYRTLVNNKGVILLIDIHPFLGVDPKEVCEFLKNLGFSIYEIGTYEIIGTMRKDLNEILAKR